MLQVTPLPPGLADVRALPSIRLGRFVRSSPLRTTGSDFLARFKAKYKFLPTKLFTGIGFTESIWSD